MDFVALFFCIQLVSCIKKQHGASSARHYQAHHVTSIQRSKAAPQLIYSLGYGILLHISAMVFLEILNKFPCAQFVSTGMPIIILL